MSEYDKELQTGTDEYEEAMEPERDDDGDDEADAGGDGGDRPA